MVSQRLHEILARYWGYNAFRPLQEEIMLSVMEGHDTLALLPTGGGKSLCFQVPGLAMEGLTLVVTPLIALMKDQVENLRRRDIPAEAIYSGMTARQTELALNHAGYGKTNFLYLSPERLVSERFREVLPYLNIRLIAVDEAHCISQWGYDFRPPYLRIAEIREFLPEVPVIALTATATKKVVEDIQQKLSFKNANVFEKSFERRNLAYIVQNEEDKYGRLMRIMRNVPGTGIVYVRNRRKTREIAEFLTKNLVSADHYHAGLDHKERERKQAAWKNGKSRVMVATNAFGMGIDKPDVRFVVHFSLPDSIEAYFQEAGRGGRDEKKAYAVMLFQQADILESRATLAAAYPEMDAIKNVYAALGNYFNLVPGTGKDLSFDFELADFSAHFNLKPLLVFNAIKFMEREGYLLLNEAVNNPSRLFFNVSHEDLYNFQVENALYDPLIKTILRSYGGVFTDASVISENELAQRLSTSTEWIIKTLNALHKIDLLTYLPRREKPQLTFVSELIRAQDLSISPENYSDRKRDAIARLEAVIGYVNDKQHCRSQSLVNYFGQAAVKRCGICDVCIERNKASLSEFEFDTIVDAIKPMLKVKACSLDEIINECPNMDEDRIINAINWLTDNEKIQVVENGKFKWND
ncbi:MAG: ATP-dependent DNA helicase RecQ [Lentimicrobium sp.]|jgi:ATP-dependent DNA helicase RecQ|nr:ATP-dependent DNA helicase RecQ [Lentimicrobium sp.]